MTSPARYIEVDLLRTLAIVLMVIYHVLFDLAYFYSKPINVWNGPWRMMGRTSALLFLLLVGISFILSYERARTQNPSTALFSKYFSRGCFILSWGLVISLVTALSVPQAYVRFGILHLIGLSTLLLPLFAPLKEWNALIGIIFIMIGRAINQFTIPTFFLLPLGLPYPGFQTLDYYPLLPWMGVILLGMAVGHFCYVRMQQPTISAPRLLHLLTWPGKHSLAIYLIHQPVILGILWAAHH